MKKNLIFLTILLSIIAFIPVGCRTDDVSVNYDNTQSVSTLLPSTILKYEADKLRTIDNDEFHDYEEIAKIFALSLNNQEFRDILKKDVLKKFDNDYDVLFYDFIKNTVNGKSTIQYLSKDGTLTNQRIQQILKSKPLLNISIPVHAELWDTRKNNLLVAALTSESNKVVKAFDINGKLYYLDHLKDPNVPVIVIGYNERVSFNDGKYTRKPYAELRVNNIVDKNLKINSCSFPYRVNNNYEFLKEMKFLDLNQYESWTYGAPEIKARVLLPQSPNNFTTLVEVSVTGNMEPPNRAFINNAWWNNADVPLFYWDSPNKSSTALFHFLEMDDSGSTNTFTIGLGVKFKVKIPGIGDTEVGPNLGYSVSWKATDKEIGRFPIEQFICPPIASDNCYQLGTAFQFKSGN